MIDACQTNAQIAFIFNLGSEFYDLTNPDNIKGLSIKQYIDKNFYFHLTRENKQQLINDISKNFVGGEICHYAFYCGNVKIGQGYDYCVINTLNPDYFVLKQEHLDSLDDAEIHYSNVIGFGGMFGDTPGALR